MLLFRFFFLKKKENEGKFYHPILSVFLRRQPVCLFFVAKMRRRVLEGGEKSQETSVAAPAAIQSTSEQAPRRDTLNKTQTLSFGVDRLHRPHHVFQMCDGTAAENGDGRRAVNDSFRKTEN